MQKIEEAIGKAIKFRKYNALITETFDVARKQAKSLIENGIEPFPVVVKDCYTTRHIRTTCASKMLADYTPHYTATVIQRLFENGGCLIGKSNLDEFCMGTSTSQSYFGPCKNGLTDTESLEDNWFVPGGSSGGSAVAVQLGFASIGIGSDTGGSTRNPAAFTGLFGLKPSYGILSRYGLIPLVNSLDCPAIIATTAEDCNRCLKIMCGIDRNDSTSIEAPSSCFMQKRNLDGLIIGIPFEYCNESLSTDCWNAWNDAAKRLAKLGCKLKNVSMPHTEYSIICYHILGEADIASNMARFQTSKHTDAALLIALIFSYDGIKYGYRSENARSTHSLFSSSRSDSLNEVVRRRIFSGNYFLMKKHYDEYYGQALRAWRLIKSDFDRVFKSDRCDALLTPVTCSAAPKISEINASGYERERVDDFYTQPANLAGVPAISVPITKNNDGMPLGVQIITNFLNDGLALDVASCLNKFC